MTRVPVAAGMLRWARERARVEPEALAVRFPTLAAWEAGESAPTLRQLEAFARAVRVPVGYLFLPAPPREIVPITDLRTMEGRPVERPSPEMLDTIHACQERQAWFREFAEITREPVRAFVGSAGLGDAPRDVAARIRATLQLGAADASRVPTWEEALRQLIRRADAAGILVMVSGIVGSNTRRTLDPDEFRGFALADRLAPLVFVNGADTKAAQMFTLAHELAHLWLGLSGVSDLDARPPRRHRPEEVWCNAVAAEVLVPADALRAELRGVVDVAQATPRLARHFKVSTLVILRRLLDAGAVTRRAFDEAWAGERARLRSLARRPGGGGDFYNSTLTRVGRRFDRAMVESTREGQTLYRDAFRMLGVGKLETFERIGEEVSA